MNKQEAINKLKSKKSLENCLSNYGLGYNEALDEVIYIINQLDEPEKPVVPQFVAEWYEENKDDLEWSLYDFCVEFHKRELPDDLHEWFANIKNKPIVTLVKMKLFGYEVEKEKLYEVFLKRTGAQLGVCVPHGEDKTQFTKVELQEYDFDNLDVYEVEEVE